MHARHHQFSLQCYILFNQCLKRRTYGSQTKTEYSSFIITCLLFTNVKNLNKVTEANPVWLFFAPKCCGISNIKIDFSYWWHMISNQNADWDFFCMYQVPKQKIFWGLWGCLCAFIRGFLRKGSIIERKQDPTIPICKIGWVCVGIRRYV